MLSEKEIQEIKYKLDIKKIKQKNQKYIIEYINLNTELFPFLNIKKLTQRIINNFNTVSLNKMSFIYKDFGQYNPLTGKVLISPKLFYGKKKKYKESVIFHELDHCACSPVYIKEKYNKFKLNFYLKHKIISGFILDFILNELFFLNSDIDILSGVATVKRKKGYTIQKFVTGNSWQNHLNEGITSLKQILYSDVLKIKFHEKNDFYLGARMGVECLANVIGFENMIYLHFNNDFCELEKRFNLKSCITLEELMVACAMYDSHRSRKNFRRVQELVNNIKLKLGESYER